MADASSNQWVSQMDIEHQLRVQSLRNSQTVNTNDLVKDRWQVTIDTHGKQSQPLNDVLLPEKSRENNNLLSEIDTQPVTFEKLRPMQSHFDRIVGLDTRQMGKNISKIKK